MKTTLKRLDAWRRRIDETVARCGRLIMTVGQTIDETPDINECFSYSIGNYPKMPELLCVGLLDAQTLNVLSGIMLERGRRFDDGEIVSLGAAVPICVVEADESVKQRYTFQATAWHGSEDYSVMQVVAPDKAGRFPWQAGCEPPYSTVKVYRRKVH